MSYSDDLDWLARNVHKWPFGLQSYIYVITFSDGVRSWGGNVLVQANKHLRFDKEEWLARRAELQNKPSWADAPEWAQYLVQNCIGLWTFTRFEPKPNDAGGWSMDPEHQHFGNRLCVNVKAEVGGAVLGDWRYTLEQRPVDEAQLEQPVVVVGTGGAIQGKCPNCGNTGIHACIGRKVTNTDTANEITEWVTKQQAKETSDWYERGELPPVGTVCEVLWNEGRMEYLRTKVFGVNEHGQPIHRFDEGPRKFQYQADPLVTILGTKVFRPIRTDHRVLVDLARSNRADAGLDERDLADAILAAGFRC